MSQRVESSDREQWAGLITKKGLHWIRQALSRQFWPQSSHHESVIAANVVHSLVSVASEAGKRLLQKNVHTVIQLHRFQVMQA